MVEENIISVNKRDFEIKKKRISEEGADKLQVISDFDRTITYGLNEGNRTPTVISQLRSDGKYLGENYAREANRLFDVYHPIEIDLSIPLREKQKKMHEWWTKHFDLIVKSGLTKQIIHKVIREKPLRFRKGSLEFISLLNDYGIPLIFMSAAPGDMLIEYLKENGLLFPNVYVISNLYEFDKNGKAIKIQEPIIHTFNKTEVSLKEYPVYKEIKPRTNVILLGDSVRDIGMIEGFPYKTLLKIGFLNENVEQDLADFKKNFDIILLNDIDMDYVNHLAKEIFEIK